MCCISGKPGEELVRLVLFQAATNSEILPGLMTDRGIVDISGAVKKSYTPQLTMQGIIDDFDRLRPALEKLAGEGKATPLAQVRLKPPLPRPGKILACIANYWEHAQREARPLNMFMRTRMRWSARATRLCCRNSRCRGPSCTRPSWRW